MRYCSKEGAPHFRLRSTPLKAAVRAWLVLSFVCAHPSFAQLLLNTAPTRVIGQTSLTIKSVNPNLVEGREFYLPQGIAIDSNASPAHLYVADTLNNRVLGFNNAQAFANGQKADLVLGQADFGTTFVQGPNHSARTTGFSSPTGIAVDAGGNVYVVDSGNNRILRFPRPFSQAGDQFPDLVIGQKSFATNAVNQDAPSGSASASSLNFTGTSATGVSALLSFPAFDGDGNLWVPDSGNNRVLRFNANVLNGQGGAPAANGPSADLVLGQTDFRTNTYSPPSGANALTSLRAFANPTSVAFDSGGRLFVSEARSSSRSRILVFTAPFVTGSAAARLLGVDLDTPAPPVFNPFQMGPSAGSLFAVGDSIGIADTANSRILVFPPFATWTSNQQYQTASAVAGQTDFSTGDSNRKLPETGPDRFANPSAALFYGGELYVVDSGNHRVIAMPTSGTSFGPATRVLGQVALNLNGVNLVEGREFNFSQSGGADTGMVTDFNSATPHLYVADTFNNRILCYRDLRNVRPGDKADFVIGQPDFLRVQINYPSNDPNQPNQSGLFAPTGLTLDSNGNLYVADTGNGRVLRFPRPFDNFVAGHMPQADLVLGQSSFTIKITDPSSRTMSSPYGVAFSSTQGLLVSDVKLNRVLFFQGRPQDLQNGQAAALVFGQPDFFSSSAGSDDNKMNGPRHIATDSDDRLYVADTNNGRILVFDHAPSAGSNPHAALALPGFTAPRCIYVNPVTGEIWIADSAANTVTRYPQYNNIAAQGFTSTTVLSETLPLAVTQDVYGNVYVADNTNRVVVHFPGLTAINAANYLRSNVLAPGMIAALFATNSGTNQFGGSSVAASAVPLPKQLNNVQVTINDIPCPLFYAGSSQINIQVPWTVPTSGTANLAVTDVTTGRVIGAAIVSLSTVSPGLFTLSGSGTGPAAALNSDGTVNSAKNPAAQGSYVTLFGTGQGVVGGTPPQDGDVETGVQNTTVRMPTVIMNAGPIPDTDVQYSGLAPNQVGVWQINAKVPDSAPPSTTAPPIQLIVIQDSAPTGGGGIGRPVTLYVKQK